jgi:hypothetical protein
MYISIAVLAVVVNKGLLLLLLKVKHLLFLSSTLRNHMRNESKSPHILKVGMPLARIAPQQSSP